MTDKPIRGYLAPDIILAILLRNSPNHKESIRILDKDGFKCVLSDFALYEALACMDFYNDEFDGFMLKKLIDKSEFFDSQCYNKVSEKRRMHLREVAGLK